MSKKINAIFWDFDGTLADTRHKNFHITRLIYEKVTGKNASNLPILKSFNEYDRYVRRCLNWRDFYSRHMHFDDQRIDEAGALWTKYQLSDKTPAPLFTGIPEIIKHLANIPQAIISQNSSLIIKEILNDYQIRHYFDPVIGYEEVGYDSQKPDPAGLIHAIGHLELNHDSVIIYIGDHETDMRFAKNGGLFLKNERSQQQIISIAALYGYEKYIELWDTQPDFRAYEVSDIIRIKNEIEHNQSLI